MLTGTKSKKKSQNVKKKNSQINYGPYIYTYIDILSYFDSLKVIKADIKALQVLQSVKGGAATTAHLSVLDLCTLV